MKRLPLASNFLTEAPLVPMTTSVTRSHLKPAKLCQGDENISVANTMY